MKSLYTILKRIEFPDKLKLQGLKQAYMLQLEGEDLETE